MRTPIIIILSVLAVLGLVVYVLTQQPSASETPEPQQTTTSSELHRATSSESNRTMTQTNGLQITDETVGTGDAVKVGDTVSVHYRGTLQDGSEFDSSYKRGQPFSFKVGLNQVIQGWDQGLLGMKVGGKRRLVIPSELGYGPEGYPPIIPPSATLTFEIELLQIK
jgi:peptidylprolyl isomerase